MGQRLTWHLNPTSDLIEKAARSIGTKVSIDKLLCDKAFDALSSGDVAGHNKLLIDYIIKSAKSCDTVVLAQASMTNILPDLPLDVADKVLTSPRLGLERTAQVMMGLS